MSSILAELRAYFTKHWPLVITLILFGWLFLALLSSHMIYPASDGWYSGGSAWGDLAFHLTLINNFKERGLSATLNQDPIFTGSKLSYPFIADYLSALLTEVGLSLRSALILPSFIFLFVLTALIYLLTLKMTQSRAGALIAPFIFFFNGSIFGLEPFWRDLQKSGMGLWKFLGAMVRQYAYVPEFNIHFSNVAADFMLAQRTFILGLAVGLGAVYFLWSYWESGGRAKLFYAGFITAALPLIHLHSFMTIAMAAGFLFLIAFYKGLKNWKKIVADWLCFLLPVALLGLPQVLLIFPWNKAGFLRFQFGWMKGSESLIWFWIKNLSPHIFIFLWAWFRARPEVRSFYLAFFGVFVVANLLVFEPYDFNNSKFLLWWYLIGSIVAAGFLGGLFSKSSPGSFAAAGIVIALMTVVGVLSVWREYRLSWQLFSNEDIAFAGFVKKDTPKGALFLTSDAHNNPVSALAGRRIVMGYRGWLWTYGIDHRARERDVLAMYVGGESSRALLNKYGVGYVLVEERKITELGVNRGFFKSNFPIVYQNPDYALFKVD